MKRLFAVCCLSACAQADLLDELSTADQAADAVVSAIATPAELTAKQAAWRTAWIEGLGGLPARTPLNARVVGQVQGDGFRLENILFESQPGVFVTAHLALPTDPKFKAPYPGVLMPLGHSDTGILNPRYAAHLVMTAKAGFAAFAWDPISQGERRQSAAQYDYTDNCSTEHTRLGARGWLVGWNFARFRIWDGIRAIDYLETRTDVDCSKLGVMGTSGGGTMSAYLQALDPRIKVAFPNCYISSLREVFRERGCHDAEQFFFNQLNVGVNHAAMLALGQPRVALATGSRWKDYFPQKGAEETFAVFSSLCSRLGFGSSLSPSQPSRYWHFHCDGPHGLPPPTRAAQTDWMSYCIQNGPQPRALADYQALGGVGDDDPVNKAPLPFRAEASFATPSHQVRDLPGFKSVYTLIAERAQKLAASRATAGTRNLQEIVRRRAGIRPLSQLLNLSTSQPFNHPRFNWWYLKGAYGCVRENEAALLATLGRSVVGRDAENLILKALSEIREKARQTGSSLDISNLSSLSTPLKASGWDCVAAAHAYAAEPQLFSGLELVDPPPSWTEMVTNPDPRNDSYAIGVWGALEDYDWVDLVPKAAVKRPAVKASSAAATLPNQGVELLIDGQINPACAFKWTKKPIEVVFDFVEPREIGGVRLMAGRSYTNRGVKKASFYVKAESVEKGEWVPLAEHVDFRPSHTYKENYATWNPRRGRTVKMVIEDSYDQAGHYYCFYTWEAQKHIQKLFETPPYRVRAEGPCTVQIAEMSFFGRELPQDLPLPNADGSIAYPETRLVRDWLYQSCAVSNISHCANVEPDTTKPDPLGEDISSVLSATGNGRDPAWRAARLAKRRAFLAKFRAKCDAFIYVKHLVMGNSIMHATDDMTDASFQEWKQVPDYRGGSQLIRATINADGTVSQEVLLDEPQGIIRDPALSFDARTLLFSKRTSLEGDDYHIWKMDLETKKITQLTFNGLVRREDIGGTQEKDFTLICSDIEPCWLPDGTILFQSTRCCHSVDCWPLPVSNLYRCEADGSHVRRIGFDQVQTFYPQLMDDGRVSFTKWEYNDRSASGLQQLYAMNSDGTKMTGLFANNSEFPFSLMHTRGIPGTRDIMMISCGHHVAQKGRLARSRLADGDDYTNSTYDPAASVWGMNTNAVKMTFPGNRVMTIPWSNWDNPCGPAVTNMPGMYYLAGAAMNAAPGVQPTRMPHDYQYNAFDMHTQFGPQWAYPYPLGDGDLLVSFMPEGCSFYRGPYSSRFGVYAMNEQGERELLAFDWGNHCLQPIAFKPRRAPARPMAKIDYREGFGTYYVQNVYEGAASKGIPKGAVKKLRVIGLEYRPVHIGWNWQYGWHSTQGKIGTPISVGNGAYDVKHVLGEADVEADGSCSVKVPARTPVYFQLVDKDGCAIQTMRSWSTLMPGEVNGCIGCHEHPHQAAVDNTAALALRRPPQSLKPWLPNGPRHPFVETLEKEGPLASLDAWMGLNRPKKVDASFFGDGFGFEKDVQPILNRSCVRCHGESHRLDLRDVPGKIPPSDDQSHRAYTAAYLALSEKGRCTENVNFAHGLGFAPFKPPYSFGALRSKWYQMLKDGHPGKDGKRRVALTDNEIRTFALWIDLAIPFSSSYVEANKWCDWHQQRFLYTNNKRSAFHWLELNDIRKEYGMEPVPLTGFKPGVEMPRRQKYWSE